MKTLLVLTIAALGLMAGCTGRSPNPNIEVIQDMMESPAVKAQEFDESSPNGSGMRVPPEHTAPVGFEPYPYTTPDQAAKELKNPIAGDQSQDVLMTGQKYFETNCMVCHGMHGEGGANSSVAQFMALKPPAITSDKVRGWNDAQIYHVITMGQGVMGPYASHIPQKYRWQVVNYIRHLQNEK